MLGGHRGGFPGAGVWGIAVLVEKAEELPRACEQSCSLDQRLCVVILSAPPIQTSKVIPHVGFRAEETIDVISIIGTVSTYPESLDLGLVRDPASCQDSR